LSEVAARKPTLEPRRTLRRRTVGEGLRTYTPSGHPLHPVVTHGAGRPYPCLHIFLLDEIALRRRICPDTGKAIRL
jgi:hypothetical protein